MIDQVTVIIPTKNRVKILLPLVRSIIKSDYVISVYILNNSQTKIAQKLGSKVRVFDFPNYNLLQAKNYVTKFISTKWTLVLDDDVRITPNVISDFITASKQHYFDIASGVLKENNRYTKYDPIKLTFYGKYSFYSVPSLNTDNLPLQNPYRADVVPGGFMFIRSFIFAKINYDTNYLPPFFNEDSDFQINALKKGYVMLIFSNISGVHLKYKSGGLRSVSKYSNTWWYSFGFNNVYFRVKNFGSFKLFIYFIFRPQDFIFVLKQKQLSFLYNFMLGQINGYKKAKESRN